VDTLFYLPDGPNVLKLALDVTSREAIIKTMSASVEKFGHIDVVINNAGYALMGDTEVIPESEARLQMETLFWGPVLITQEAVRIFRERNPAGKGGTIVQVSSIGGYLAFPGSAFYHASKFALGGFTQSFAKEMDPNWGIKFMIVAPGGIKSNFHTAAHIGPRHPAYDTPTGPLNQLIQYMMNPAVQNVFSDPDQIAKVLFNAVVGQDERPLPTRLLMGGELIPFLEAEHKRVAEEVEAWKEETISCSLNGELPEVPIF
jgi:NAD(P)-dependent dehydrogenase (short-subunit alcohol dehydrogenase family)